MGVRLTISELEKLKAEGKIRGYSAEEKVTEKKSKYGNKKVEVFGKVFDSKKEATRYFKLMHLEKAGEISDVKCQVEFQLSVCKYRADFTYLKGSELVVEDVKSKATRKLPVYRLKKKLMKAELGVDILET